MFTPTSQQIASRDCTISLEPGEIVAINAAAGTGKTTTMGFIAAAAHHHRQWRTLYLCYNKEMAVAATSKMPSSVECRTVHSLAYSAIGYRYRGKLGNVRPREAMTWLKCSADQARSACAAINQFLCSDDFDLTMSHVEDACGDKDRTVLAHAVSLWSQMTDATSVIPLPHDGYLKLWCLSQPNLCAFPLVLVDESQDMNPCILHLLLTAVEKGARVVFVGDTHQSLYGYRLAVDAMQVVSKLATHNLQLTESWRFPQPIATAANKVLHRLKEIDLNLIGRGSGKPDEATASHCTIARTNARLLQAASGCLCGNGKLHFAATKANDNWDPATPYRFQELLDVYALYSGRGRPLTPHLNQYADFQELSDFAKGTEEDGSDADPELAPLVDFIERHTHGVPDLLKEFTMRSAAPDETNLHFSTCHRAKGKEWNTVALLDDFLPLDNPEKLAKWRSKHTHREGIEAVNLLYVAVTRGRCSFAPPASSAAFFAPFQPIGGSDHSVSHRIDEPNTRGHPTSRQSRNRRLLP